MPIIGNTDVANLGEAGLDFDWEISLNKDDVLVCPASQTLTEFNCRVDTSEFATGTNTIEIGIHDVTTGYAAAPLIASQIINIDLSLIPYVASVAGLSIDLAAYAGQTLAIGHARAIQNSGDMAAGFESGSASRSASMSTALVNPHVENDTVNYVRKGMWAELVGAADTTDPVLVLSGTNPDTFVSGTSYVDPGAAWTDNVDGSGTVTADNSPTDFIAAQLLNYNFTDAAGNAAVQVQRTVNVTVDAGHTKVDLVDPAPATAGNLLGGYTPSAPITGMQLVHESVTDQGIAVTSDAAGNPTFATVPTVTQTLSRFTIDTDGNRNAAAVYSYTVAAISSVQNNINARWSILNSVFNDSESRWSLLSSAQSDADVRWSAINSINNDTNLNWSLLNSISNDSDLQWSLLSSVLSDAAIHWDLLSALSAVTSDVDIRWDMLSAVVRSANIQWSVLNTISSNADLRWSALNAVAKNFTGQWSLLQAIQNGAEIQWDITVSTQADITLRWAIQSDDSFPDLQGVITLSSQTPKITLASNAAA